MFMPSRSLKFATDFFALQIIGLLAGDGSEVHHNGVDHLLRYPFASPAPTLMTTLSSFGICITLL